MAFQFSPDPEPELGYRPPQTLAEALRRSQQRAMVKQQQQASSAKQALEQAQQRQVLLAQQETKTAEAKRQSFLSPQEYADEQLQARMDKVYAHAPTKQVAEALSLGSGASNFFSLRGRADSYDKDLKTQYAFLGQDIPQYLKFKVRDPMGLDLLGYGMREPAFRMNAEKHAVGEQGSLRPGGIRTIANPQSTQWAERGTSQNPALLSGQDTARQVSTQFGAPSRAIQALSIYGRSGDPTDPRRKR